MEKPEKAKPTIHWLDARCGSRGEKNDERKNYQPCRGYEYESEQRSYAQGRIIIDPIEQFTGDFLFEFPISARSIARTVFLRQASTDLYSVSPSAYKFDVIGFPALRTESGSRASPSRRR
jgi:hypothetical protein